MGKLAAENENKEFVYVAITAEYNKDKTKYLKYENKDFNFIWTNWQTVTNFLEAHLIKNNLSQNKEFANDLYFLLIKKRLRSYIGLVNVQRPQKFYNYSGSLFYNLKTSKFKGEYSGFMETLAGFDKIGQFPKFRQKSFFQNIKTCKINKIENIFYNGN